MSSQAKNPLKKRQTWNQEAMKNAIIAVREKNMGYLKAAKSINVPKTTLIRLSKKNHLPLDRLTAIKLGRKAILPENLENDLVIYVLAMENSGFGLSRRDIKSIAYQLAIRNNLKNSFFRRK